MHTRRTFVKTVTKTLSGTLLPSILLSRQPASVSFHDYTTGMDEEQYWMQVRSMFPLNKNIIFLNNATLGPSPFPVIEAENKMNLEVNTTGHGPNNVDEALTEMAAFLNTKKKNIAFTHNVTEGINIGVWSLDLKKSDEVILSTHEHVGNAVPWLNRARQDGIVLKAIDLKPTAAAMLDHIKKSVTNKTKVIALPHIPCTTGQVLPLKEICEFARQKGIYTLIDGAHGPGMLQMDLPALECDLYASCCHKWLLGPKGTGFVYFRDGFLEKAIPKFMGAFGDTGWNLLVNPPIMKGYVNTGNRFFYGTQNTAHYAGILAAIKFHEKIGKNKVESRVKELSTYLQNSLLEFGDQKIEMLTPTEASSRAGTVSFRLKKTPFKKITEACLKEHIILRGVSENELNCVRISTHIYNNFEQLDTLVNLLKKLA